jgi:hypothetical protein
LTWAGSFGTPTCSSQAIAAGTLTSAEYSQSYNYDQLDRLTIGTDGISTYDDPAHLHAATAIGPSSLPVWTASYDAAGNMTCRAPTSTTTCTGTPAGAQHHLQGGGRPVHGHR